MDSIRVRAAVRASSRSNWIASLMACGPSTNTTGIGTASGLDPATGSVVRRERLTGSARPFREGEAQNQIAAATAPFAATRGHRHEFLAVHHVHGRRRKNPAARVEL